MFDDLNKQVAQINAHYFNDEIKRLKKEIELLKQDTAYYINELKTEIEELKKKLSDGEVKAKQFTNVFPLELCGIYSPPDSSDEYRYIGKTVDQDYCFTGVNIIRVKFMTLSELKNWRKVR